jgi:aspartyl-tRNA(Asn)/glutamyl-tRNA(Gln) amidotransferase subunit B
VAWEIVVGIETHAQLLTRSKIFSGASTAFGAEPNTQASAVDIALPGVLPVLNAQAVELAVRFGIAVGATINRRSVFARKNFFYPDLPKGYQISQYEIPVVQGGSLKIVLPGGEKTIRLTRAHLEEDTGKSLHEDFQGMTGIDLNRAGTPLLEIVTEPDLRGAKEAVAYARTLHGLVRWIGICDGNMQEGSFRCDANVSVRKVSDDRLGTRCEIKNLNSFRFMEQAIEFEARRQVELIEDGKPVLQETRLYDPDRNETRPMRLKEDAQDYRYFPDPDLLPLVIAEEDIARVRTELPELPSERMERFISDFVLTREQAHLLTNSKASADYFEETLNHVLKIVDGMSLEKFQIPADEGTQVSAPVVREVAVTRARLVANWILGEVSANLNRLGLEISDCPVVPLRLAQLLARGLDNTVSKKLAREVFEAMWAGEGSADEIIEKRGLKQISDAGAIGKIIEEVLAANAKQVEDYRAGRQKAFNSLVGQVMKHSQGKANPAQVNEILRRKLKET